jgi:small subunit ribosomal protein S2
VKEANRMGIPVVGIVDTNADPDLIDYVIPANDDAVGSLKLLIGYIFSAWVEGKTGVSAKSEASNPKSQETTSKKEETKEEKKEEAPKKEKKTVKKEKKG